MSSEAPTALVTGASSGIGRELARLHAARGGDLVLVARRAEALEDLKAELEAAHGVSVIAFPADLANPDTPAHIFEAMAHAGVRVDYLINNAGFGARGRFWEIPEARQTAMLQVNVAALTALTRLFLSPMVARGHGRVLNIGSTAGFLPGPMMAVYYASKAYVLSFSEALAEELEGTGVRVTVLCPGPVATEFAHTADMERTRLFRSGTEPVEHVARKGYEAMRKGRRVAVTDPKLAVLLNGIVPFMPRRLVTAISRRTQEEV